MGEHLNGRNVAVSCSKPPYGGPAQIHISIPGFQRGGYGQGELVLAEALDMQKQLEMAIEQARADA